MRNLGRESWQSVYAPMSDGADILSEVDAENEVGSEFSTSRDSSPLRSDPPSPERRSLLDSSQLRMPSLATHLGSGFDNGSPGGGAGRFGTHRFPIRGRLESNWGSFPRSPSYEPVVRNVEFHLFGAPEEVVIQVFEQLVAMIPEAVSSSAAPAVRMLWVSTKDQSVYEYASSIEPAVAVTSEQIQRSAFNYKIVNLYYYDDLQTPGHTIFRGLYEGEDWASRPAVALGPADVILDVGHDICKDIRASRDAPFLRWASSGRQYLVPLPADRLFTVTTRQLAAVSQPARRLRDHNSALQSSSICGSNKSLLTPKSLVARIRTTGEQASPRWLVVILLLSITLLTLIPSWATAMFFGLDAGNRSSAITDMKTHNDRPAAVVPSGETAALMLPASQAPGLFDHHQWVQHIIDPDSLKNLEMHVSRGSDFAVHVSNTTSDAIVQWWDETADWLQWIWQNKARLFQQAYQQASEAAHLAGQSINAATCAAKIAIGNAAHEASISAARVTGAATELVGTLSQSVVHEWKHKYDVLGKARGQLASSAHAAGRWTWEVMHSQQQSLRERVMHR